MNMRKPPGSDYACQYRTGNSVIHRLPSGWKLLLSSGLCIFALVVREPAPLLMATGLCFLYYFLARLTLADLWRDIRFFLVQAFLLILLFTYEYGYPNGLWPGVRTSLQIVMFFLPGMVFLRTTQASSMMKGMRKIVSHRVLFLIFTSLRFVPFFAREMREIIMAQKLRGARLKSVKIYLPGFWADIFHCLVIPMIVRALKTAHEAALSAQARGMGVFPKRTYYDERELEKYIAEKMVGKTSVDSH